VCNVISGTKKRFHGGDTTEQEPQVQSGLKNAQDQGHRPGGVEGSEFNDRCRIKGHDKIGGKKQKKQKQ